MSLAPHLREHAERLARELGRSVPHCFWVLLWCDGSIQKAREMLLAKAPWEK